MKRRASWLVSAAPEIHDTGKELDSGLRAADLHSLEEGSGHTPGLLAPWSPNSRLHILRNKFFVDVCKPPNLQCFVIAAQTD